MIPNDMMTKMMMQLMQGSLGGQQQDNQGNLANNLLSSAAPALGTVANKITSGEKFNVGDIGSVLQGASPALNMIPGVGTIASAGTNILGSVLQGLGNKQEEFKAGQVLPQVSNPYMCGGRLKSYQFGGPMKQYNAPPHSMGGQAVDANGNPVMNPQQGAAEIEKQEMYSSAGPGDGFIFSDEIRLPNGMTLAQKAAEIEKKFGKFDDAISRAAKERELKKLAEYGETMKQRMLEQQQQQQIQDMQRMQAGVPTDQQMQQQMMMQQGQMQQGMPQQQMQQGQMPMMQGGGKLQSSQKNEPIYYEPRLVLPQSRKLDNSQTSPFSQSRKLDNSSNQSNKLDSYGSQFRKLDNSGNQSRKLDNSQTDQPVYYEPRLVPKEYQPMYMPEFDYSNTVMPRDNTAVNMPMMQFGGNLKSLNSLFNNGLPKFSKGGNNKQNTDPPSSDLNRHQRFELLRNSDPPPPAPNESDYPDIKQYEKALEDWGMKYPYYYIHHSGLYGWHFNGRPDPVYQFYKGDPRSMINAEIESLGLLNGETTNPPTDTTTNSSNDTTVTTTPPSSDSSSVASTYGVNPLTLDSILSNTPQGGYGQWGNSGEVAVPQEQSNSTEPPEQNRNFISRASEILARAAVGWNDLPENFVIPSTIGELFSNPIEGQTNFGTRRTSNPSFLRGLTRSSYLQDILSMPRVGINFSGLRERSQDNNPNPWKLIEENNPDDDSVLENFFEFFDPTGVSNYDDAAKRGNLTSAEGLLNYLSAVPGGIVAQGLGFLGTGLRGALPALRGAFSKAFGRTAANAAKVVPDNPNAIPLYQNSRGAYGAARESSGALPSGAARSSTGLPAGQQASGALPAGANAASNLPAQIGNNSLQRLMPTVFDPFNATRIYPYADYPDQVNAARALINAGRNAARGTVGRGNVPLNALEEPLVSVGTEALTYPLPPSETLDAFPVGDPKNEEKKKRTDDNWLPDLGGETIVIDADGDPFYIAPGTPLAKLPGIATPTIPIPSRNYTPPKAKKVEVEKIKEKKPFDLNYIGLGLKGAGLLGSAIDAFQKPEVDIPRLPNFAAQDQYFAQTGIDPQYALNQANLQKNAALQQVARGAGSYGQFLNRVNSAMRNTQDAQSESLLAAKQYNDQMAMARGSRGDRNATITSQIQAQTDQLNAMNRARSRQGVRNFIDQLTQAGTTISGLQYDKEAAENQNKLNAQRSKEFVAALAIENPDFAETIAKSFGLPIDEFYKYFLGEDASSQAVDKTKIKVKSNKSKKGGIWGPKGLGALSNIKLNF